MPAGSLRFDDDESDCSMLPAPDERRHLGDVVVAFGRDGSRVEGDCFPKMAGIAFFSAVNSDYVTGDIIVVREMENVSGFVVAPSAPLRAAVASHAGTLSLPAASTSYLTSGSHTRSLSSGP